MNTCDDQAEQSGGGQRDIDFFQRIDGLQARVVERVVLLCDGFLLRAHEFVNGLTRLDGERHSVKKIRPQGTGALVSHNAGRLWQRCVPLFHKRLNALDF